MNSHIFKYRFYQDIIKYTYQLHFLDIESE